MGKSLPSKERWEGTVLVSPQASVSQLQSHASCFAPAGAGALQIPCHPCQQVLPTEGSRSRLAGRRTEGTCSFLFVHCPASLFPARARQSGSEASSALRPQSPGRWRQTQRAWARGALIQGREPKHPHARTPLLPSKHWWSVHMSPRPDPGPGL